MPPTQRPGGGHQPPAQCALQSDLSSMPSAKHRRRLFLLLLLLTIPSLLGAQFDYPTANLSTVWINSPSQLQHTVSFEDGSQVRSILLRRSPSFMGPTYACGFYCTASCDAFLFAVFIVNTNSGGLITNTISAPPQVVWSANRGRLVKANATLHLTAGGDLVLKDADGTGVWSTSTSGGSVTGMNITASGNLVLFDRSGRLVWQSFDHPTDSLVLGQTLKEGQRLTANISLTNWTQGQMFLTVLSDGLYAFAASNPPQLYYKNTISISESINNSAYVKYTNGSLDLFVLSTNSAAPDSTISLPFASSAVQFMRLEYDGHLRVFEWKQGWQVTGDVLGLKSCDYPTVCGEYGICFNGQCSCPVGSNASSVYFKPINDRQSDLGCSPVIPLSCQSLQEHRLLEATDISYFSYNGYQNATFGDTDAEVCKQACLRNCSCKAALFRYGDNVSSGECFLLSQLLSLQNNQPSLTHYNSTAYIKVQVRALRSPSLPPSGDYKRHTNVTVIVAIAVTAAFVIGGIAVVCVRRGKNTKEEVDDLQKVSGMPRRFSFEELRLATNNFSKMLGQGGFGSVYEGSINDEKIAVKRLGRGKGKKAISKKENSQDKKDFLAEVKTIGSVHHINLVRMVGYCAEKSERLLVYEYMCNGSLDKWIYNNKGQDGTLDWQTKRRIISDIAKGLCYLHEECRQKIVHSDIKPQNILLDDKFNAKISDFGLAKPIDRDKLQVSAVMDGTIGYIAPERRSGLVTEKVDTYSFGVLVMETVCGRKNLDDSQPAESFHLLGLLHELMQSNRLEDIVDVHSDVSKLHRLEAIEMIKLAVWCLQGDSSRRPSMSAVVKVLEGSANVETDLGHNFLTTSPILYDDFTFSSSGITSPSASLLPCSQ